MEGALYFVTWRLAKRQPILVPDERSLVVAAIRHFQGQRYEVPAYVVMDDHVHVLVLPFQEFPLHSVIHSWKSFSSKRLVTEWSRRAPVWQHEYFDRIVRDEAEFMQKANYIGGNPLKRWPDVQDYPWMGFGPCL
jgi:REP element-mobilizing transposase RayT